MRANSIVTVENALEAENVPVCGIYGMDRHPSRRVTERRWLWSGAFGESE